MSAVVTSGGKAQGENARSGTRYEWFILPPSLSWRAQRCVCCGPNPPEADGGCDEAERLLRAEWLAVSNARGLVQVASWAASARMVTPEVASCIGDGLGYWRRLVYGRRGSSSRYAEVGCS